MASLVVLKVKKRPALKEGDKEPWDSIWDAHSSNFPSSRRVVLRVWLCDPELHKHLAVPDRGSARVPDDDRQRANVSEQAAGIVDVC